MTRKFEVVFWVQDPDTKKVIGDQKCITSFEMELDAIEGAAMRLSTQEAIKDATPAEIARDAAFRRLVLAVSNTITRHMAQILKKELHP